MGRIFRAPLPCSSRSEPIERLKAPPAARPRAGREPHRRRWASGEAARGRSLRAGGEGPDLHLPRCTGREATERTARPARAPAPPGVSRTAGIVDPASRTAPSTEPLYERPKARPPTVRTRAGARPRDRRTSVDSPTSRPPGPPTPSVRPCYALTLCKTPGVLGLRLDCLPSPSLISAESGPSSHSSLRQVHPNSRKGEGKESRAPVHEVLLSFRPGEQRRPVPKHGWERGRRAGPDRGPFLRRALPRLASGPGD